MLKIDAQRTIILPEEYRINIDEMAVNSKITATLERYTHLMDKSADGAVPVVENKGKEF